MIKEVPLNCSSFMEYVQTRAPHQPDFHQAVQDSPNAPVIPDPYVVIPDPYVVIPDLIRNPPHILWLILNGDAIGSFYQWPIWLNPL